MVNSALVNSPIGKRHFYGAHFCLSNLVLTTGLHEANEDLGDYLEIIVKALRFIGPTSATYQFHGQNFCRMGYQPILNLKQFEEM
jgi:hypothetical protein